MEKDTHHLVSTWCGVGAAHFQIVSLDELLQDMCRGREVNYKDLDNMSPAKEIGKLSYSLKASR